MTARKQLQHVYISTTGSDLSHYRQMVLKAIHAIGIFADDMIIWPEEGDQPAIPFSKRKRQVEKSDLFILIMAHRFGRQPRGHNNPVNLLEYQAARKAGLPAFAFFLDESVPWPPDNVDWEKRDQLKQFKKQIQSDIPIQIFQSHHELATMVSQSLVLFLTRQKKQPRKRKRFHLNPLSVDPGFKLKATPDVILEVGCAEDGLPLLFEIKRSESIDLKNQLVKLAEKSTFILNHPSYKELIAAIDKHSVDVLTQNRLFQVRMQDGRSEELYVSSRNLTRLFYSTFAHIIDRAEGHTKPADMKKTENKTVKSHEEESEYHLIAHSLTTSSPFPFNNIGTELRTLQSVGGRNRFLGVSLMSGKAYSVGQQGGDWVEWRPFIFESIPATFPDCRCHVKTRRYTLFECAIPQYQQLLMESALNQTGTDANLDIEISFKISRQSIGKFLLLVSQVLAERHAQGRIHGDVKPANIVLASQGPVVIDEFDIEEGDLAPGWTPIWSAPEQVLKEPASRQSDIYPLGRILTALIEGRITGEVRRFKIPPLPNGTDYIDIYYNPSIYVEPDFPVIKSKEGLKEWLRFIKSCLMFSPDQRPADDHFYEHLSDLVETYPLQGEIELITPGNLVAATLLNGKDSVARLISDSITPPPWFLPPGSSKTG